MVAIVVLIIQQYNIYKTVGLPSKWLAPSTIILCVVIDRQIAFLVALKLSNYKHNPQEESNSLSPVTRPKAKPLSYDYAIQTKRLIQTMSQNI